MAKYLIFLESFTKQKTIKTFLGNDYEVFATSGHLMELAKRGYYNLGVDLTKFTPYYDPLPEKNKNIKFWQNYLKKNKPSLILLATDPDREGEGIAQEIVKILQLQPHHYKRLLFYEITQQSIKQALSNPLSLNQSLVEAQNARQVLDRMIGFCLSPLLRKKLQALSAGRVQSVVLKLIADREIAIREFEKKKEYILQGIYEIEGEKYTLRQKDEKGKLVTYPSKEEAEKVKSQLSSIFSLINEEKEKRYIFPKSPFTTSLLLYEAKSQLSFSIAQTTKLAQQLYEGIYLKNNNKQTGLITYPRTDSCRLNKQFVEQVYQYIQKQWGKVYCQFSPQHQQKKESLTVQDAHEAIRPTYFSQRPEEIKDSLAPEQFALYGLIYQHTLASLMSSAQTKKTTYTFVNNGYYFTLNENVLTFAGFFVLNPDYYLPNYKVKKTSFLEKTNLKSLEVNKIEIKEYLENKPQRYNEGSLVQELERLGIGRPSTYNTFSRILLNRGYVEYNNDRQKHFVPTELGFKVNEWLQKNFASLINEKYTANLEAELDKISQGKNSYLEFIQKFWNDFFPYWQEISNKPV
ncbi:type I DNA topoisomerase [endosymbiont GvMRE of Glomus versiforme]|uniref:type I DNA topoisomerase n=1 Tax=endosymbiont GvMRE of Glomus versiforme TaxID=2039283 RepID=UPI000EEDE075|nr:type I DNA topoisomerase [endosymbiont GvMRE of Glomus versiforme]RHZ36021.1 DNA topoisomerase [endosymbiont GvMRE of Glomus versiforme]